MTSKWVPSKHLFEHVYPNGNRVVVTSRGVTIWDKEAGRWVVDASCMNDDNLFSVCDVTKKTGFNCVELKSLYPADPQPRKRKVAAKKPVLRRDARKKSAKKRSKK